MRNNYIITVIFKYKSYNNKDMKSLTTIAVKPATRDKLKKIGFKGETYDEIIEKLMKTSTLELLYEQQKRILEQGEFIPLDEI